MEQHFLNFFKKEDNLACSQTIYFLLKVRWACVIKYKQQGIYWPPAQGRKEKKNETMPVYRLRATSQLGIPKFWKIPWRFLSIQFCPGISIIFGWMVGILYPTNGRRFSSLIAAEDRFDQRWWVMRNICRSWARYFGNSTISGISGNLSGKFLYCLPLFPNFLKFWLNGKHPSIPITKVSVLVGIVC